MMKRQTSARLLILEDVFYSLDGLVNRRQLHKENRLEDLHETPHHETVDPRKPFMLSHATPLQIEQTPDTKTIDQTSPDPENIPKGTKKFNFTNTAATLEEKETFLTPDPFKQFKITTPFELNKIISSPLALRRGMLKAKRDLQIKPHHPEESPNNYTTPETSL